jgi:alpha-beta hydrolase superfamily lysophospholipase
VLPRVIPNLRIGNGLDASKLSHDPLIIEAYKSDPLVHDRISARLARFIAEAGAATLEQASRWSVPTLLMYAGADRLVRPAGSRAFAATAPEGIVTVRCFEQFYHEIFNELDVTPVLAELKKWLDVRI